MNTLRGLKYAHEQFFKNKEVVYVGDERVVLRESYGVKNLIHSNGTVTTYLLVTAYHPESGYECFVTKVWYKNGEHLSPTTREFGSPWRNVAIRAAKEWIDTQKNKQDKREGR